MIISNFIRRDMVKDMMTKTEKEKKKQEQFMKQVKKHKH